METHTYHLPTGDLSLVLPDGERVEDYLFVAARRHNPRRGFLFVSTLLGKHVAVPLDRLDGVHRELASRIPRRQGDVLVIGMAETATLLGYGVFGQLHGQRGERGGETFFLQSTRHPTGARRWAFEEAHSHAPQQWLEGLDDGRLAGVRHLVLVDDELSTGATFERLEAVVREVLPGIEATTWTVLTDFRSREARRRQDRQVASLLGGHWTFQVRETPADGEGPPCFEERAVDPRLLIHGFGRSRAVAAPGEARAWLNGKVPRLPRGSRVLVLGTGEFMPLPYEFARRLAAETGAEVSFQATTRSPAAMPGLSLGPDHQGGGVPQFLYNHEPSRWDAVFVVVETPDTPAARALAEAVHGQLVSLHDNP